MDLLGDRYELHECIGEGGMATVFRAWDRVLHAARAVKRLKAGARRNARYRSRFAVEAQAMASIDHPNIVRVYDYGDDDEATFMVMALAEGGSVGALLDAHGAYPVDRAVRLTIDVLGALAAAHAAGVIHRDVKPMNILLDGAGHALVADFGIARMEREDREGLRQTRAGVSLGTFAYMAPEQRTDARTVTRTADIYAAAATLFELITGETPIDLFAIRDDSPRWAAVPEVLRPILRHALAYRPEDRFADADAFRVALEAVLPGLPTVAMAGARRREPSPASDGATRTVDVRAERGVADGAPASMPRAIDDLAAWYRRSLGEKAEHVREATAAYVDGVFGANTRVRRLAHALRGSGGTFGFPSVSEAAALVEDAPPDELVGRATALVYVLRHLSEPEAALDLPVVLVASGEAETVHALQFALRQPRQVVRVERSADDVKLAIRDGRPSVIVLDLSLPGLDVDRLADRAPRATHEVPVVVLGPDDGAARAWSLASGASSYHARPYNLVAVAAAVESARRRHRDEASIDPLTRLPDRAAFRLAALRAEHTADTATSWTLGAVAWPELASESDEPTRDALVGVLAARLRAALPPDVELARWDGAVFTWLAVEDVPEQAARTIEAAMVEASSPIDQDGRTYVPRLAASAVGGRAGALGTLLMRALDAAVVPSGRVVVCHTVDPVAVGRVLVCDDDPSVIQMVTRIAQAAGLEVKATGTGAAARRALAEGAFDLLVLDVDLPDIDGFEVLRALRANTATAGQYVMMLTAKGREPHQVLGMELGADDYVSKPFDPAVLQARMRRLVQRARQRR